MRIAITQYNHKPSFLNEKAKQLEIKYLIKILKNKLGENAEVYIVSYPVGKEKDLDFFLDYKENDLRDFDLVILYNIGHNEKSVYEYNIVQTIQLIECKNVIYFNSDPKYGLVNFPKFVKYRIEEKHNKLLYAKDPRSENIPDYVTEDNGKFYLNSSPYTKQDIENFQNIPWKIFFCGRDYKEYQKKKKTLTDFKILVNDDKCIINSEIFFKNFVLDKNLELVENNNKNLDLFYYGDYRIERAARYKEYLRDDLSKVIVGFSVVRRKEFKNSKFYDYLPMQDLCQLSGNCIVTIIMGDITHDNNIITPRFYESLYLDCVKFIDISFDPHKKLFEKLDNKDFYYVRSGLDLKKKIEFLKNNPSQIRKIITEQYNLRK